MEGRAQLCICMSGLSQDCDTLIMLSFICLLSLSLTFVPLGQSSDLEMRTPAGSDVFDPGCSKSWGEAS